MAFKSHDVRRMAPCQFCQQIGIHKPNGLPIPTLLRIYRSPDPKRHLDHFVHPRCVVKRNGIDALLALPTEELGEIRIGDITRLQMKTVLSVLRRRKDEATTAVKRLEVAAR